MQDRVGTAVAVQVAPADVVEAPAEVEAEGVGVLLVDVHPDDPLLVDHVREQDDAAAQTRLMELLLDPHDTAVTLRAAEALVALRTQGAFRLVVLAAAAGDVSQRDWIGGAVLNHVAPEPAEGLVLRGWLADLELEGGAAAEAARTWVEWYGW